MSFKDVPCAWLPFSPSLQLPLPPSHWEVTPHHKKPETTEPAEGKLKPLKPWAQINLPLNGFLLNLITAVKTLTDTVTLTQKDRVVSMLFSFHPESSNRKRYCQHSRCQLSWASEDTYTYQKTPCLTTLPPFPANYKRISPNHIKCSLTWLLVNTVFSALKYFQKYFSASGGLETLCNLVTRPFFTPACHSLRTCYNPGANSMDWVGWMHV